MNETHYSNTDMDKIEHMLGGNKFLSLHYKGGTVVDRKGIKHYFGGVSTMISRKWKNKKKTIIKKKKKIRTKKKKKII